jgi:hypothetical protein
MAYLAWQQYGSEDVYPDGPDDDGQDRYWRCRCGAFLPARPTLVAGAAWYWVCKRCGGATSDEPQLAMQSDEVDVHDDDAAPF